MSSQTRIVILKMRTVIYTGIFIFFILVLSVLLFLMFGRKTESSTDPAPAAASITSRYYPGSYHSVLTLGEHSVNINVTVSSNRIESIQLQDVSPEVLDAYPVLEPAAKNLTEKILAAQSTDALVYEETMQYTQSALLHTIQTALQKAAISNAD